MTYSATRFPDKSMKMCWKCAKRGHRFWSMREGEKVWCTIAKKYRKLGYEGECER